jgi:hypothetical protein
VAANSQSNQKIALGNHLARALRSLALRHASD